MPHRVDYQKFREGRLTFAYADVGYGFFIGSQKNKHECRHSAWVWVGTFNTDREMSHRQWLDCFAVFLEFDRRLQLTGLASSKPMVQRQVIGQRP
jgi:hypothetical protein